MHIPHRTYALTHGPGHHFFGYYGVTPWNASQTQLVCLESDFQDHLPSPEEPARIGLVDAANGRFVPLCETRAWNLQQGTWLYWNPLAPDDEIIHNDRKGDSLVSMVRNIHSGLTRELARPINALSRDGRHALCLSFGRLERMRPVVGYVGARDPFPDDPHPDEDGVFLMDMESGRLKLVLSIAQVYGRLASDHPELAHRHMWLNHVAFNPSGNRFHVLARCWEQGQLQTGMFTVNLDGSDLRQVIPFGSRVSHFDWRSDTELVATFNTQDGERVHHCVDDATGQARQLAGRDLAFDGHMAHSPDGRWLATDRNHLDANHKELLLMRVSDERVQSLHSFDMQQARWLMGDTRCDLHPRWNRASNAICVDSIATDGTRQLSLVELEF